MNGGAWWAAVHGVTKSRTWLRLHFHFSLSSIGEGNGNPLQCSCLENPRDGGAWWAAVYGVAQSQTGLKRHSSSSSSRGYSLVEVHGLHCRGFSCFGAQALGHTSFSSCGTRALLLHGMWDLPHWGSNSRLLHWQMDSLPLRHQPLCDFLNH